MRSPVRIHELGCLGGGDIYLRDCFNSCNNPCKRSSCWVLCHSAMQCRLERVRLLNYSAQPIEYRARFWRILMEFERDACDCPAHSIVLTSADRSALLAVTFATIVDAASYAIVASPTTPPETNRDRDRQPDKYTQPTPPE